MPKLIFNETVAWNAKARFLFFFFFFFFFVLLNFHIYSVYVSLNFYYSFFFFQKCMVLMILSAVITRKKKKKKKKKKINITQKKKRYFRIRVPRRSCVIFPKRAGHGGISSQLHSDLARY